MTRTLIETLESLGHTWSLVDRRFSTSVAEVGVFNFRKLASAAWMPFRLFSAMFRFRPQIVVFFATNRTYSFLVDWVLSELLRRFDAKVVLYLHTVGFEEIADRGRLWARLVERLLSSGDTVVALGPSLASDVSRWVDEAHIAFVANTASEPPDELRQPDPDAPAMVLYLSNLIPEKGADVFVDTALELMQKDPDLRFVLAGAPTDQDFTALLTGKVTSSSDSSRFVFVGAVTDAVRKWELLREASVLAFPSTYPFEAQPLTILEALSVGTPVVAFDVGGIRDVIRDGIDGTLVQAGNRAAFEASLLRVLADRHEEGLRRKIYCGYKERFSRSAFERSWASVLGG